MKHNSFDNFLNKTMFPAVIHCDMIVTTKCNLYCSYCFMEKKEYVSMSDSVADAAVNLHMEYSREQNNISVTFIGGEPLLELNLIKRMANQYLRFSSEMGKKVSLSMTTNGTLLSEEVAESLARLGIIYLLSIDGSREVHDRYRHFRDGSPTWDLIVKRIEILKKYQPWQGARITVCPDTVQSLYAGVVDLFDAGINQFIIGAATGITWCDSDIDKYREQMVLVMKFYDDKIKNKEHMRITLFEYKSLDELRARTKNNWGCGAGRGRLSIDPKGIITGCAKIQGCNGGEGINILGDVFTGLTNAKNRYELNWMMISQRERCQKCDIRDSCSGGCPAVNFTETGNMFTPSDHNCKLTMMYLSLGEQVND